MSTSGRFVLFLTLAFTVGSGLAHAGDHTIRFGAAYLSPTGDYTSTRQQPSSVERLKIEADEAFGLALGYEYRFDYTIGLDVNLIVGAKHDLCEDFEECDDAGGPCQQETTRLGDVDMTPLTVGVNFHFLEGKASDLYVGAFVGYVFYGDLKIEGVEVELKINDDFGYGAVLGLDVPLGDKGWTFSAAAKYMKTKAEVDVLEEAFDIDPLLAVAQLGYRF